MSEKRERAETLTTVQRDHVHKALAVQEGRDDHVAAASQDKGDGTALMEPVVMTTSPMLLRMSLCTRRRT